MKGNIHVQKDVVKRHQMSLNVICNRELQSLTSEKCSEINIIVFICWIPCVEASSIYPVLRI